MRSTFRSLAAVAALTLALPPSNAGAQSTSWANAGRQGDFVIRDFRFTTGETLPELRLHYTTLGTPRKDARGIVQNAVMILHGTGGSGRSFMSSSYAGELFGPGKLLDSSRYFIVLPDGIGHGVSSKPSDGLHAKFPKYNYDDMVLSQHELLTRGLGVNHVRLIMGTSMGCMHAWVWGYQYPDFMDGLAPYACVPAPIAGRNRMIRTMAMDDIRNDPAWKGGEYTMQPPGLRGALQMLYIMGTAPLVQHAQAPTRDKADSVIRAYLDGRMRTTDANDFLYQFDASRDYDPSPHLSKIVVPALYINSADDFVNPPELGLADMYAATMPKTRFILLPITPETRGHGTHSLPKVWGNYLREFMATLPGAAVPRWGAAGRAATKAFTGATLIDGTGHAPIRNATVLVRDGRVVTAGPAATVTIPAGAERIGLDGKFLMPGLINTHGHASSPADLATYAAYGITTVFSLGGEPPSVFAARAEQGTPSLARARVYLAGPVLAPATPAEARQQVADVAAQKVDIVKIRVDDNLGTTRKMTPDVYRAVIDEAHEWGLPVAVHLYYLADAKDVLAAGADFIAHSVRDLPVDAPFVAALKQRGACYTPTLMREVSTYVYESTPSFLSDSLFLTHANREWVAMVQEPARQASMKASASAQRYKAQLPVATRNLKTLFDAGVPVVMGTDTGPTGRFQGYFELMELELMVAAGLTPSQAVASATLGAARCMKLEGEIGTVAPGRWADFVVLDASPLERISNVRRIHPVWTAGNRIAR
jgi:homoserine O-acetyltransferase